MILLYFCWNSLYISKKSPRPNLKVFQYQIWISRKRLAKYLSSKTNLKVFLEISWPNSSLKICQRPYSYKNCQTNQIWRTLGRARNKKLSQEPLIHKLFETNSIFHMKQHTTVVVTKFLLVVTKFSCHKED